MNKTKIVINCVENQSFIVDVDSDITETIIDFRSTVSKDAKWVQFGTNWFQLERIIHIEFVEI